MHIDMSMHMHTHMHRHVNAHTHMHVHIHACMQNMHIHIHAFYKGKASQDPQFWRFVMMTLAGEPKRLNAWGLSICHLVCVILAVYY